jgi:hypothetical protein
VPDPSLFREPLCFLVCLTSLMQPGQSRPRRRGLRRERSCSGLVVCGVRGGGTVVAGDSAPLAGQMAVFCRPAVTAPAVVRTDGTVQADAWLRDLVRLGELGAT